MRSLRRGARRERAARARQLVHVVERHARPHRHGFDAIVGRTRDDHKVWLLLALRLGRAALLLEPRIEQPAPYHAGQKVRHAKLFLRLGGDDVFVLSVDELQRLLDRLQRLDAVLLPRVVWVSTSLVGVGVAKRLEPRSLPGGLLV